jgi:hypothetical protein
VNPTFVISALWLLCMLAAASHAARPFQRALDVASLVAPFGLTLLLTRWLTPQPGWVGVAVALAAAWPLLRSVSARTGWSFAGVLAALAASLHASQGLNVWLAALLCLAIVLAVAWLARNERFASPAVRQGVWVALVWLAPILAAAPSVMAGWASAQALNQAAETVVLRPLPGWTWAFVAGAVALGLLHGMWVRRR